MIISNKRGQFKFGEWGSIRCGLSTLPSEEKDKVYYLIDMALAYIKTKKAFAI